MLTANNANNRGCRYVLALFFFKQMTPSNPNVSSYHTAGYMHGTKFQQLFHARGQVAAADGVEVIEGEEVKVLGQVTGEDVKLVQHSTEHTHTHTWRQLSIQNVTERKEEC